MRGLEAKKGPDELFRFRTIAILTATITFLVGCGTAQQNTPPVQPCPHPIFGHCLSDWEYVTWLIWVRHGEDDTLARAGNIDAIERVIVREFGTAGQWAISIAWRESRLTTGVISSANCVGIFQLSPVHRARAARLGYTWDQVRWDAVANIVVAADLYREQGTAPWRL